MQLDKCSADRCGFVVHGDAAKEFSRLTILALALLLLTLVVHLRAVAVLMYGPTANGAVT